MTRPRLPEAGLAEEILVSWEEGGAAPAVTPERVLSGPERLYALADRMAAKSAAEQEAPREQPETWVAVEVAGDIYALPVAKVEEVLRVSDITRLPDAPAPVRGITQQRGRILTVVDLRVRLGYDPAPLDSRSRVCVVSSRGRSIGLLVDAARHVVKLLPSGKQPPPADGMSERSAFILGVYHLEETPAILLDVDRVMLLDDDGDQSPQGGEEAP
jgi:purine-binding chemotaxis protein CheW